MTWLHEIGVGFCRQPVPADLYDLQYFKTYQTRDATPTGGTLTRGRINFAASVVGNWGREELVDIGIGGGRFVREADCLGYDINPHAIEWLQANDRWFDVRQSPVEMLTMWDAIEHIPDPAVILSAARQYVFLSTPIYKDSAHVLRSKHFKPGEHVWYFTRTGLAEFMRFYGFECLSFSEFEKWSGREDIESFAFKRVQVSE